MRQTVVILGAIAGVFSAIMTWALTALFAVPWLGGLAGLGLAILAGIAATWLTAWLMQADLADALAVVREPGRLIPSTGNGTLDGLIVALRKEMEEWQAVRGDIEAVGRLVGARPGGGGSPVASLMEELRKLAEALAEDARALAESSGRIAAGAADQEGSLAQATVTLESLYENTQRISKNSGSAAQAAEQACDESHNGLEQVRAMVEGMMRIKSHVENNGRKVKRLGDRSVEIGTITETIEGISKRTETLAINSEIAAARAGGEHGREFSVIAGEIRKLSERTAAATRDIGDLVEAIQADTNESVKAFSEEQSEVEREATRVREAGAALEQISNASERSAFLVDGISHSALEQVTATQDVVHMMTTALAITRQTVQEAEQANDYVRQLSERLALLERLATPDAPLPARNGVGAASRPKSKPPAPRPIPAPPALAPAPAREAEPAGR